MTTLCLNGIPDWRAGARRGSVEWLDTGALGEIDRRVHIILEEFSEFVDSHLRWLNTKFGKLFLQRRLLQDLVSDVV